MEEFWIQLLAILTLLTQTCGASSTTELIGAVGGSVTFRIPYTDGFVAFWSFESDLMVTVEFGDPPRFAFSKEKYKTRFTVSEKGQALSISQLSTEDAGTYSANIHGKIFTFILQVHSAASSTGVGIGIVIGIVVGVSSTFLVLFCKSQAGYWSDCVARLVRGSAEISATAGPGPRDCVQATSSLGAEPGLASGQHRPELRLTSSVPEPITDQLRAVPGLALGQHRPELRLTSSVPEQISDWLRVVMGLAVDQHGPEPGLASGQHGPALRLTSSVPEQIIDWLGSVLGLAMDQSDQSQDRPWTSAGEPWERALTRLYYLLCRPWTSADQPRDRHQTSADQHRPWTSSLGSLDRSWTSLYQHLYWPQTSSLGSLERTRTSLYQLGWPRTITSHTIGTSREHLMGNERHSNISHGETQRHQLFRSAEHNKMRNSSGNFHEKYL
ncbi:hypothetical protein HGM15179_020590 [Zosterops borbonicus]|uniref:Immunoglobulin subtype domain-containing protein n=1 Tax=Zosterops borbonicus TaxID=364589 RepID=A0A8K1D8H9_9PASS|nr:hypothetical protein HGM15179_020590 [Zosterops borbonicus]